MIGNVYPQVVTAMEKGLKTQGASLIHASNTALWTYPKSLNIFPVPTHLTSRLKYKLYEQNVSIFFEVCICFTYTVWYG